MAARERRKAEASGAYVSYTLDEMIDFEKAQYVLWPNKTVLHQLEKVRKAKTEGTPFHLIDWDDNDG